MSSGSNEPGRPRHWLAKLGLLCLSIIFSAAFAEVILRLVHPAALVQAPDERNLAYRYDTRLGWFPIANSQRQITASRTITATHNSQGFRGPEPGNPPQPGIIFLGDSLVWGFDVEANERFTEKLQARHPQLAIYNFGVGGYGTDQEYLLLQRYFQHYRPRLVFLVICGDNDNEDNSWNCRGGYYKPYFIFQNGGLTLKGVPVPRSARIFFAEHKVLCQSFVIRLVVSAYYKMTTAAPVKTPDPPTGVLLLEMRNYVLSRGTLFAVGLQHSHAELESFLKQHEIPYADLTTTNSAQVYPAFGNHWTPDGHTFVADKIDEFLRPFVREGK